VRPGRNAEPMRVSDPRNKARREVVAAIIGAEAGIGVGLLVAGGTVLAPLAFGAVGAGMAAAGVHTRHLLVRRWLRAQLRAAR
jgi:hypothetical protein